MKLQKHYWNTQISLSCHCGFVFQIKSFISIGCITLLPSWSNDIFWFGKLCKCLQELITIWQQSLIVLPVSSCHLCTLNYQFKVVIEQIHIHLEYHFIRVSLDSWYSNHWLYCYFRISKSLKHHLLLKIRCIQMEGVNGTHRRKYSDRQFKADEVTLMLAS